MTAELFSTLSLDVVLKIGEIAIKSKDLDLLPHVLCAIERLQFHFIDQSDESLLLVLQCAGICRNLSSGKSHSLFSVLIQTLLELSKNETIRRIISDLNIPLIVVEAFQISHAIDNLVATDRFCRAIRCFTTDNVMLISVLVRAGTCESLLNIIERYWQNCKIMSFCAVALCQLTEIPDEIDFYSRKDMESLRRLVDAGGCEKICMLLSNHTKTEVIIVNVCIVIERVLWSQSDSRNLFISSSLLPALYQCLDFMETCAKSYERNIHGLLTPAKALTIYSRLQANKSGNVDQIRYIIGQLSFSIRDYAICSHILKIATFQDGDRGETGWTRYALARLYYSNNGSGWLSKTGWKTFDNSPHLARVSSSFASSVATQFSDMHGITVDGLSSLPTILNLSGNLLSGFIASDVGFLGRLTEICLAYNNLTGLVPSSLAQLQLLIRLDLTENNIQGPLPLELELRCCPDLRNDDDFAVINDIPFITFTCFNNPEFCNDAFKSVAANEAQTLASIGLKETQLRGKSLKGGQKKFKMKKSNKLPIVKPNDKYLKSRKYTIVKNHIVGVNCDSDLALDQIMSFPYLQYLCMSDIVLNGSLPNQLRNLVFLRHVMLSRCNIQGNLPVDVILSCLTELVVLNVSGNAITGTLDEAAGLSWSNLKRLVELDVSRNRLSGSIPPSLSRCLLLKKLRVGDNRLTGRIPTELASVSHVLKFNYLPNQGFSNIEEFKLAISMLSLLICEI